MGKIIRPGLFVDFSEINSEVDAVEVDVDALQDSVTSIESALPAKQDRVSNSVISTHSGANPITPDVGLHFRLSSPIDPGTPATVEGRASVVHGFTLTGGSVNFTNGANHAHFFHSTQKGDWWQTINCGDFDNLTPNRILQYSRPIGVAVVDHNRPNLVSVDTRQIGTVDGSGTSSGFVILNYSTNVSGLVLNGAVSFQTNPGIAGLVAGTYPGEIVQLPTAVGPIFEVRIKLWNLGNSNFIPAQAALTNTILNPAGNRASVLQNWPAFIPNVVSIEPAPEFGAHRARVIFSAPHGWQRGRGVIIRPNAPTMGLTFPISGYIFRVISSTELILSVGTYLAANTHQPLLTGGAVTSGFQLIVGNLDTVHNPTANLQSYVFERDPYLTPEGQANGSGYVRSFSIGAGSECAKTGADIFAIGQRNTVTTTLGGFAIGNDNTVRSAFNSFVVGLSNNLQTTNVIALGINITTSGTSIPHGNNVITGRDIATTNVGSCVIHGRNITLAGSSGTIAVGSGISQTTGGNNVALGRDLAIPAGRTDTTFVGINGRGIFWVVQSGIFFSETIDGPLNAIWLANMKGFVTVPAGSSADIAVTVQGDDNSQYQLQVYGTDATLTSARVSSRGTNTFSIRPNAAATADTIISWQRIL